MKSTGLRILILTLVILSITVVFFIGFKLNIAPHIQSEMDRWVGIATVCTAISSAIVGLISVWVMFDQKKVQDRLMEMQIQEHQPIFKIKIEHCTGKDKNDEPFDYEEVKIRNVGNASYILKEWDVKACVNFKLKFNNDTKDYFIHLYDYFGNKTDDIIEEDVLLATCNSDKRKNVSVLREIINKALDTLQSYDCKSFIIERRVYTRITYIDLYGNQQSRYFINTSPVDEVGFYYYDNNTLNQEECNLEDLDIEKYIKELKPKKPLTLIYNK